MEWVYPLMHIHLPLYKAGYPAVLQVRYLNSAPNLTNP